MQWALEKGARAARLTLTKSTENLVATLDGKIDRVTHCEDRSLSIALFAGGKFGAFSTNRLSESALKDFIVKSLGILEMLAPDPYRRLPDEERYCRDATTGLENDLYDPTYMDLTPEKRTAIALDATAFGSDPYIISEEGEWSDSEYDCLVIDSHGLECHHSETCFDYGVEITVQTQEGDRYSGYWWNSSPYFFELNCKDCGLKALQRAKSHIGSAPEAGGKYNMVVDTEVAGKMVSPLLSALSGYAIQQKNSFLDGSLGKQVFPEGFTMNDCPHIPGQTGSKLFDSEGVATVPGPIVENGVVKKYFLNTYMAGKLGMAPTIEEATRPKVEGWPKRGLKQKDILGMCGSGILVTDFNGGNSNPATGDFSYGIEGFLFENGEIVRPVSEMLVTGNFLTLWNNLIAAGSDARPCMSKLIPTLAFSNVDFNG